MADVKTNRKTRILLVDDEEETLDLISEYLKEKDFDLSMAVNAEQAINMVEQDEYQIAIVDLHLPGMTGSELLKMVKKMRSHI
ncbi:response regulator, partial [archaeon]|nr:response regulator [archaeon]